MAKPTIKYWGTIKDGRFTLNAREQKAWNQYVASRKDGRYYITAPKRVTKIRSLLQNSYYWVLMTILGDELGCSKDAAHEMCKLIHHSYRIGINGPRIPLSTTDMTRLDFVIYIEAIRNWAAYSYINQDEEDALPRPINLPPPNRFDDETLDVTPRQLEGPEITIVDPEELEPAKIEYLPPEPENHY